MNVARETRFGGKLERGQLSAELLTPAKPNLLDRIQQALRPGHSNPRAEQTYCMWVERFICFRRVRFQGIGSDCSSPQRQFIPQRANVPHRS